MIHTVWDVEASKTKMISKLIMLQPYWDMNSLWFKSYPEDDSNQEIENDMNVK